MLSFSPPSDAYARDAARLGADRASRSAAARWLPLALLLDQYAAAPDRPADGSLPARLAAGLATADGAAADGLTAASAGLRVAADLEDAGAFHLAFCWLTLLERIVPASRVLDTGRIVGHRARIANMLDAADTAEALYRRVEALGVSGAEPELTSRAWIGYAALARMRGNNPEARRWYYAAALVADDTGCIEQSFLAHLGLLVGAAMARDFDAAMVQGGLALRFTERDARRESQVLSNIAQVLYDSGHHAPALRGFAAVVSRAADPRVLLSALGGAATAAAALGDRDVVHAAARRVERMAESSPAFSVALALIEVAEAYRTLGDEGRSAPYLARGRELAAMHGFHGLVHRADAPVADRVPSAVDPARVAFSRAASRVISDIEGLAAPADLCAVS